MSSMSPTLLAQANKALRAGELNKATALYERALNSAPHLERAVRENLQLIATERTKQQIATLAPVDTHTKQETKAPSSGSETFRTGGTPKTAEIKRLAVLFHFYHEDVVDYCLERISRIPVDFDLIVTTPHSARSEGVGQILKSYPSAQVISLPNRGRDIGPMLKIWPLIQQYELCCKIHTKKGVSDYIEQWRNYCFDGVLPQRQHIQEIINEFQHNKLLSLAGPEMLFGAFDALLGNNSERFEELVSTHDIQLNGLRHNGFFMGTMFWFRPKHLDALSKLQSLEFPVESGQKDGGIEHSIERLLGTSTIATGEVMLIRPSLDGPLSKRMQKIGEPSWVRSFHSHFDRITQSQKQLKSIVGHLHTSSGPDRSISGWLALRGDPVPRRAVVIVDGWFEMDVVCDRFRPDLKRHGVNEGFHAFSTVIPFEFMDGQSHTFALCDLLTGKRVAALSAAKAIGAKIDVVRTRSTWIDSRESRLVSYLASTTAGMRHSPESQPLVSIVMPTYNRAFCIANAVNSVLMQSYANYELHIVDDGSTDDTAEVLALCYRDSRIKVLRTENRGVSHARNVGLSNISGDFIFFLDSDNTWNRDFLLTMIAYMQRAGVDAAYCGMAMVDDSRNISTYKGSDFSWEECLLSNFVDLNTFGYRVTNATKHVKFDEGLKRLVDWDLILHIGKDTPISFVPFLGVRYYDGSTERITNSVHKKQEELLALMDGIRNRYKSADRSIEDSDWIAEKRLGLPVRTPKVNSSKPSVCTIITSFNHQRYIAQAIESVAMQTGNFDHQILISDDGSTDDTRSIIEYYSKSYPDLIVDLSQSHNVGVSENMRRCIEFSDADYVAICEGDDYWTSNLKLQKQIDFMRSEPSASMVFSQIDILNVSKRELVTLARQAKLEEHKLTGQDFLDEPTMNLIGNFSCCLFDGRVLRSLPRHIYESRLNEIAIAFYFDRFGTIGFLKEVLSVYRQHDGGLWTGRDQVAQLQSGVRARELAMRVASSQYRDGISKVVDTQFRRKIAALLESHENAINS